MNTLLLIFFALPLAVIIISIALQKILKCPFLVAAIIFAIFLVVTFIIGNLIFLVATIAYAILAFITSIITNIICKIIRKLDESGCKRERECCSNRRNNDISTELLSINGSCCNNNCKDNNNLLTISSNGCNGVENELLTINTNCNRNNHGSCSCSCNTSNDSIAVRANVFPNNNANGRSGSFCGCFRRR
ncbi:MAG: DUF2651 family protein [Clostridia bacterium]|nr:DUF2651 family protein [Clostridia bacterium]